MLRNLLFIFFLPCLLTAVTLEKISLPEQLKEHIHFSETEENLVGHLYIGDQKVSIDQGTWLYVKQGLDYYKEKKPILIILELNTPGGEVYAAQKISDALKEMDTQYGIPIVCYINNWAISAGAMLAYSCRFIAVAKDATMGAAEPIIQTAEGTQTASEKINSAIRADFANRAAFFGRDPVLAEAMVDKDLLVVKRDGNFVKLSEKDQILPQDVVISPKGKLLTLTATEIMEYGVGDILLGPIKMPEKTAEEKLTGQWTGSQERLFHASFFDKIPHVKIDAFQADWKTNFFVLLSNSVVSSLLFMGLLMGAYMEINSPGLGFPALLALTCLFLIILSSFAMEAIHSLELIMFITGALIVIVDLFLLPTFGILGIIGAVLATLGLFAMMLPGLENFHYDFQTNTFNAAGEYVTSRFFWLCLGFVGGLTGIVMLARYVFPTFGPFNRFVLKGQEQDAKEGYVSGVLYSDLPTVNSGGVAISNLKPSGKVQIDNKIYEALSDGEYLERDTKIVVTHIEGNVVIVRKK